MTEQAHNSNVDAALHSLQRESDRGSVLVGTAFIDNALKFALHADFSPTSDAQRTAVKALIGARGPLGRMWARLQFARARRIVDDETGAAIDVIRTIRNRFAHDYEHVTFAAPELKPAIETLVAFGREAFSPEIAATLASHASDPRRFARTAFEFTVMYVVGFLHGYVSGRHPDIDHAAYLAEKSG